MRLEHWFYTIPLRLRSLFRRSQVERELDEEFHFHLARRIEQEMVLGKTWEEARYAALRAMQGFEQRKEECRDARQVHWLEDIAQDTRYAVRILTKTPGFAVVAAMVVAVGIGANTAVFTIVNGVLLRPLPFPQADRLFLVSYQSKNNRFARGPNMSDRDYLEFRRHDRVFESLATFQRESVTLTGAGDPVAVNALTVTPDFLRVLRVQPAIGRDFLPGSRGEANVVLLSDRLWRSRWGGALSIIGKTITLDGVSYVVGGVMPPGFAFQDAELWIPSEIRLDPHNSFLQPVMGRLKPWITPRQAHAELQAIARRLPLDAGENRNDFVARILPLKELFVANVRKLLLVFTGAVGFVFLIACANFASLLLIRGASRQREIAVRAALGARRSRLIRQLLAESTLLSLAGGAAGILLSIAGVQALLALLPPGKIPRTSDVQLDAWVLTFAFGLSLLTGVVFSLAPALQATRRDLREAVSEGARNIAGAHDTLRGALVTAEIALALILLVGAGLLVRSFLRMCSVNPGFQSANILTVTVDLPHSRYRNAAQMRELDTHVLSLLSSLPEAKSVAAVSFLPFGFGVRGDFQLEGGQHLPPGFLVDKPVISPGYFRTMGIRLLSGRGFTEHDNFNSPGVVIVSESVARRLWPAGDAIGKRISMENQPKSGDWLTIIGIVSDVRQQSLTDAPSANIYLPYPQVNQPFFLSHMSFVVQASESPSAMASGICAVIHKLDKELPAQPVTTMEATIADTVTEPRSQTRLLGTFSMMALFLAAVGIYGVLASSVAERTHEVGIRMAMGAEANDVLWMVVRRTLVLTARGVLIGTLAALAVTRVLSNLLFEVKPSDPLTFVAVTAILVIVALVSASIPAQRAARVDPLVALRCE